MKITHFILLSVCFSTLSLYAQVNGVSIGIQAGVGDIKGKAVSESAFGITGFLEVSPDFWNIIDFRFDYSYMCQIESLFPENSPNRYYPSIQAFSLKIITRQIVSTDWFIEEGLGPMALNDKTYSDVNEWDYGIAGIIAIGIDFKQSESFPITITAGSHFGLSFTNTIASYIFYNLQLQYFLSN